MAWQHRVVRTIAWRREYGPQLRWANFCHEQVQQDACFRRADFWSWLSNPAAPVGALCFPRQATPRYWARSAPLPCSSRPRTVGSGARCAIIGCSPIHACCLGVRSSYRVPRHFHRLFTGSRQDPWPAYRALWRRSGSATRRSRSTGWSGSTGPVNSSSPCGDARFLFYRRLLVSILAGFIEFETPVKVLDALVPSSLTATMIATEMPADQARRNEGLPT